LSAIQAARKINNQPRTIVAVVEDAIKCHYNRIDLEQVLKALPPETQDPFPHLANLTSSLSSFL
jgi:hypothetical protein